MRRRSLAWLWKVRVDFGPLWRSVVGSMARMRMAWISSFVYRPPIDTQTVAPMLGSAIGSPDTAFGVLRDLLIGIEDRLALVRSGVERRQALALATPSIWPVTGWLSSAYGTRRDPFTGGSDFHPGLDISSPQGEPVLAPADGVVSSASFSGNYGNLIVLDHGFGIITRYGHLSRYAVMNGQQVRRGDVIGFVGTTGRSTSPHLHYEILVNGQQTNPLRLLAQR